MVYRGLLWFIVVKIFLTTAISSVSRTEKDWFVTNFNFYQTTDLGVRSGACRLILLNELSMVVSVSWELLSQATSTVWNWGYCPCTPVPRNSPPFRYRYSLPSGWCTFIVTVIVIVIAIAIVIFGHDSNLGAVDHNFDIPGLSCFFLVVYRVWEINHDQLWAKFVVYHVWEINHKVQLHLQEFTW